MAQMVEGMPTKHNTLRSNLITTKKNKFHIKWLCAHINLRNIGIVQNEAVWGCWHGSNDKHLLGKHETLSSNPSIIYKSKPFKMKMLKLEKIMNVEFIPWN
jgi:hypothetical protein